MLCAACVHMFQDLSKTGSHHHSYDNLVKAANSGCKICLYLRGMREEIWSDENRKRIQPFTTYSFTAWSSNGDHEAGFDAIIHSGDPKVFLNSVTLKLHVSAPVSSPQWLPRFLERVSRDLQTVPWNVRDDGFDSRPIPESTGDPKVIELGLEWLDTCMDHHTQCEDIDETRQPGYYPSRLLDVGTLERGTACLIQPAVEPPIKGSLYATLSHCWGQHVSFLRLTADNINSLTTVIPLESLPKSFKDAIVVCRQLRIRYLWIDSLCILQSGPGSEEDWQHHVKDMHVIYTNCVLDIVIAHAANPDQSAFVTRNPSSIRTAHVYAPAKMGLHEPQAYVDHGMERRVASAGTGTVGPVSTLDLTYTELDYGIPLGEHREHCLVTIFAPEYDWSSSLFGQPLWKRGWVFQERLMTPRMLVFGKDRIYWQCHERMVNEYLPYGLPGSGATYDKHAKTPFTLIDIVLRSEPPSKLTDEELSNLYYEWYSIVDYYSMTDLTFPEKDKLAAIAAIAGRFHRVLPGRYLAGLFEADLLIGLLWKCVYKRTDMHWDMIQRSLEVMIDIERSPENRAPTWSWASINGNLTFIPISWGHLGHKLRASWSMVATVDQVSVDLKDGGSPYGQVVSGQLIISGLLIPLIHTHLEDSISHDSVEAPLEQEQQWFAFCIAEDLVSGGQDQIGSAPTSSMLCGLVLAAIGGNTYQRKGCFMSSGDLESSRLLSETYERRTITIT